MVSNDGQNDLKKIAERMLIKANQETGQEIRKVSIVEEHTGESGRLHVLVGLLFEQENSPLAHAAGVVKFDCEKRLNAEEVACRELSSFIPLGSPLLVHAKRLTDQQTGKVGLCYPGVQGRTGSTSVEVHPLRKYLTDNLANHFDDVKARLNSLFSYLSELYNRGDGAFHQGHTYGEFYKDLFTQEDITNIKASFAEVIDRGEKPDEEQIRIARLPLRNPLFNLEEMLDKGKKHALKLSWRHGDLNLSNVLVVWNDVCVIDFHRARKMCHAAYDFAKLETEIINHLLTERLQPREYAKFASCLHISTGRNFANIQEQSQHFAKNPFVKNAYQLICLIREKSEAYLKQPPGDDYRYDDYMSALFFHSLASLKHDNLSNEQKGIAIITSSTALSYCLEEDPPWLPSPWTDLLHLCAEQVQRQIHDTGGKYDPALYAPREEVGKMFAEFVRETLPDSKASNKYPSAFVIVDIAGAGKTNEVFHQAEHYGNECPCLVLLGDPELTERGWEWMLFENEGSPLRGSGYDLDAIAEMARQHGKYVLVFIDAINEVSSAEEANKMIALVQRSLNYGEGKAIKFCITCRELYWRIYSVKGFWETYQRDPLVQGYLKVFSDSDFEDAKVNYQNQYNPKWDLGQLLGHLSDQDLDRLKHPLLLRIFFDTYSERETIPFEDIRLKRLFDDWLEEKRRRIEQVSGLPLADRAISFVMKLGLHMLNNNVRDVPMAELPRAVGWQDGASGQTSPSLERYPSPLPPVFLDQYLQQAVIAQHQPELKALMDENILSKDSSILGEEHGKIFFVYQEFEEYIMARAFFETIRNLASKKIVERINGLTIRAQGFQSILGMMRYLGIMLEQDIKPAISIWQSLLSEGETWFETIRLAIAQEYAGAKEAPPEIVSVLGELAERGDEDFQSKLAETLRGIRCIDVAPAFQKLLEAGSPRIRSAAMEALYETLASTAHIQSGRLDGVSAGIIQCFREIFRLDKEEECRCLYFAYETLRLLGKDDPECQTILKRPAPNWSEEQLREGMALVRAGEFIMGHPEREENNPPHKVALDDFLIDECPVTNKDYKDFIKTWNVVAAKALRESVKQKPDHPVVYVDWYDATLYAQWRGKRLPTEAEWEKAAAWYPEGEPHDWQNDADWTEDKGRHRKYPWGDDDPTLTTRLNYADNVLKTRKEIGGTTPVGSYEDGKSFYGCYHMAGNVLQWCADWYSAEYCKNSPPRNPKGPLSGGARVLRGASWDIDLADLFQCAYRLNIDPPYRINYFGFRCARTL